MGDGFQPPVADQKRKNERKNPTDVPGGESMKGIAVVVALVGVILFSVAFSVQGASKGDAAKSPGEKIEKAIAVLHPTEGNEARGVVTFTRTGKGVRIVAEVEGLTPGQHGFHVHEYGDCSSPDAESAGGHFNPSGQRHGGPSDKERHVGDFGNIEAKADGKGYYDRVDTMITLDGPHSIIGRAVVVHAEPDDFKTQPTGGAGARLACGVVGVAKK
jgi:superoxide dismutase, Cu-Zn family